MNPNNLHLQMTIEINYQQIEETLTNQRGVLQKRLDSASDTDIKVQPINPDRADLARTFQENYRNKLLLARTEEQLIAIDQALLRLKNGTYGNCSNCGNQIAPKRLEVMPTVSLCMTCQQEKTK